jgi:microcystin-dependent protein
MDFEIVDDYLVTLTWEQGLDAATYSGHPVSVNVDIFNISGFETDTPAITYKGRSDNALYNIVFAPTGPSQAYNRLIKYGAVTANKKYIYAAHGKTIKVFAFDQYTIGGATNTTGCTYTYNEIASFTVPLDGFGTSNTWGIYDIKQLGNSLYVLAIGRNIINSSNSAGYAFKYDVSGGFGDPATTFGSTDVNGDTIPVWSKEFADYQVATRLEIIGKHIYASAHGGNGGPSNDVDAVQLIPLDFDGIYTAGAHIESLRMDQGYVMGDLEVGQSLTVQNNVQVAGSLNVVNDINCSSLNITNIFTGLGSVPIGVTVPFAGAVAPTGWRICDGSSVNSTNYLALHGIISNTYGGAAYTGAAGLLFNLPNLQQRVPVGSDAAAGFNPLGYTSGTKDHTLTKAEIPKHEHGLGPNVRANVSFDGSGTRRDFITLNNQGLQIPGNFGLGAYVPSEDGSVSGLSGGAHNNMQPYIIMNYIIFTG